MNFQGRLGAPLVLVVDHEPHALASLANFLHKEYRVAVTTDLDEALQILASDNVALLLTDQRMLLRTTGAHLLRSCASISPSTARVLVTDYSDIEAFVDVKSAGRTCRNVSSPRAREQLLEVIRLAVAKHHHKGEENRQPSPVANSNESHARSTSPIASGQAGLKEHLIEAVHSFEEFVQAFECLRGLVPICMYCHRVQVNEDDWCDIVEFLMSRSRILSHGVCPSCAGRLEIGEESQMTERGA